MSQRSNYKDVSRFCTCLLTVICLPVKSSLSPQGTMKFQMSELCHATARKAIARSKNKLAKTSITAKNKYKTHKDYMYKRDRIKVKTLGEFFSQ